MAVQATGRIRIRRRASGGVPGAPANLLTSEVAYNEADDTLYIGYGDDGNGVATSIRSIAGAGAYVTFAALQDALEDTGAGDMLKSVYDTDGDGKVDRAAVADAVDWLGVQGKPSEFPSTPHGHNNATQSQPGFMSGADKGKLDGMEAGANNYTHPTSDGNKHIPATGTGNNGKVLKSGSTAGSVSWDNVTKAEVGLGNADNTADADKPISTAAQNALNLKAPLASPAFTGAPKAPTATPATSSTQIATTAFVKAAVDALINGSGAALDTLKELADAIANDPDFAGTITNLIGEKVAKAANLSDLADAAAARTNLGLGSMAQQSSDDVDISGGSITGVILDGGTF